MRLSYEIEKIRENPGEHLTEACVLSLGAFLAGYRLTDAGYAATLDALTRRAFEQWLGERFSHPRAPWYALIRVYEGHDLDGLRGFISQWDEFEGSSQAAG